MKGYLRSLLNRVHSYSKDLDTIEVFVDKPWVIKDESGKNHQYLFLRDKRLLMSRNGITKTGSWELLPTNQLHINRVVDQILLDKYFIEDALLVLRLSGSENIPFVLINQNIIEDLNCEEYLKEFELKKLQQFGAEKNIFRLIDDRTLFGASFYIGQLIEFEDKAILTGTFKIYADQNNLHVTLVNNRVEKRFYILEYLYQDNLFEIHQLDSVELNIGDEVCLPANLELPLNLRFSIKKKVIYDAEIVFKVKIDSNHKVTAVTSSDDIAVYIILSIVAAFLLMIIIITFLQTTSN